MGFLKRNIQLVGNPLSVVIVVLVGLLVITGCSKKKEDDSLASAIAMLSVGSWTVASGRPFATTYTPRDGDTNVSLNVVGTVTFNEPMNPNTITVNTTDTRCSGSIQISGDEFVTCVQSTKPIASNENKTFTMTPATNLAPNTKYKARITTDAKDLEGRPFLTLRTSVDGWTTGAATSVDTKPPTVALVSPANGTVGVSKTSSIFVTFSEAMEPSTITANTTDTSCATGTFLVSADDFTTCVKAQSGITIGSNNVDFVFQPASSLANGITYKVKIKSTVKDASNVAMGTDFVLSTGFTIAAVGTSTDTSADTTPPTVSSVTPVSGATGVAINSNLTATFSETILSSSVSATSFILRQGSTTISGAVTLSGNTATFNPDSDLTGNTAYTVILTSGIKDTSNNALAANYTWTFTTGTVADTTAPTVGGNGTLTTANIGATSLTLNWTKGSDTVSAATNLQYLVYYSTSNKISTVANMETNGTAVGTYTADLATKNVTSLSGATIYFFNVIVKDEVGNKTAYTTVTATTNPSYTLTYTLTYNGNGNTGGIVPTDATQYDQGQTTAVLGNSGSLVKTGFSFAGWNTLANGSGTTYSQGQTYTIGTTNAILYAVWTALPTYTVTYNGNTNTGGAIPTDSTNYLMDQTVTILGNTGALVKTGNTFAGWNTAADGSGTDRSAASTFAIGSANVTLFAKWTVLPTYSVTYNGNGSTGGSVPSDSNAYLAGATVTVAAVGSLVRSGFIFAGWNTAPDGSGTDRAAASTFAMGSATVTLYAKWTATYTIGGSITGLTASGLVLQNNAGNNLTVASGANSFTFTTALVTGAAYAVTVQTQPTGLACTVSSGGGAVASANVTNVAVSCIVPAPAATPTFNPTSGSHSNTATNLTISTTTSGASIYFTTDGTSPTSSSNLYNTVVHIWSLAGKTVKALVIKSGIPDSTVATLSGMFSYPPLKSGQTTVYAAGDNGTNQSGVARGYTDNGNGTVTDTATGLVWQKCFKGRNNDGTCSDDAGVTDTDTWADAGTYCTGLSLVGKTWRLPTRQELETLPDYGKATSPVIDTIAFPATVAGYYWSSTTYARGTTNALGVYFDTGNVSIDVKTNTRYVRCVSGLSKEYSSNFTDNSDGTVKDNATGLLWQKCNQGQGATDCSGTATTAQWADAITYCSGLALAGKTWRLPHVNELKTIVDTTKASGAAIDTTAFPATVAGGYWSSTTNGINTANAMGILFSNGIVFNGDKINIYYVRCVSGP